MKNNVDCTVQYITGVARNEMFKPRRHPGCINVSLPEQLMRQSTLSPMPSLHHYSKHIWYSPPAAWVQTSIYHVKIQGNISVNHFRLSELRSVPNNVLHNGESAWQVMAGYIEWIFPLS